MKPIIGITMGLNQRGEILGRGRSGSFVWNEYGEAVRRAGGEPIFLDYTIDPITAVNLCNGFVISGGDDIDPKLYGEEWMGIGIIEATDRTLWERQLIDECDKQEKSILGICYGAQLLNVHYGGSLYQDVTKQNVAKINHGTGAEPTNHEITFTKDFLGCREGDKLMVASRHHQAIHNLAPGFEAMAEAEDGVIEAIKGHGHFGLQWHAESDESNKILYGEFVSACRRAMTPTPVGLRPRLLRTSAFLKRSLRMQDV